MDEIVKHLNNIYAMDRATLGVICTLCVVACYAIKDYIANPIMVIFIFPVLLLFSVLIQYLFILGEMFSPRKPDQWLMWTVMASICGNIVGIALVASLGRVREAIRPKAVYAPLREEAPRSR